MEKALLEIISAAYAIEESIDAEKLYSCTVREDFSWLGKIFWNKVRHLHIIGCDKARDTKRLQERSGVKRGCYHDPSNQWIMAVGLPKNRIKEVLDRCSENLERLSVRYTTVRNVDVAHLTNLKRLDLSQNERLSQVEGLECLHQLVRLKLNDTFTGSELNINGNDALTELHIGNTQISRVLVDHPLERMRVFRAGASEIEDTSFLVHFPNLQTLVLQETPIRELPPLAQFEGLCELNAAYTQLQELPPVDQLHQLTRLKLDKTPLSLDDIVFPENLQRLGLSGMRLTRVPESIRNLRWLSILNLSELTLDELPDWLPELGLEFRTEWGGGIVLRDTRVKDVDMTIFSRSQATIRKWFEDRKKANAGSELNEVKVVFLGDGEAGKTHTITRLLKGGELLTPAETPGDATPGIVIKDQPYDLDDRRIQVHFWDFGGQEILHSMHRIFLTERTLYVVLLNARDNTQNERARYWLHNIRSFAGDAPVLLVLNKTDQNEHATVNISDLREICPDLPEAVYLSALRDSPAEFNRKLTGAMLDAIRKIDTIRTFFPNSWKQVKDALQTMETPYIKGGAYKQLCDDNRVDEKIQRDVLDLFKTLGVSFYYPGVKLEDYVVLRPNWITNAIYIILFNKRDEVKNGLISHETIYRLLNPRPGDAVKRVLPDATYSNEEVTYVLDVVRRFRLSYLVEDGVEFIPALCGSNSLPVAAEYAADPNALEFRMVYDYLPNNVIHRLMVELRQHLDREHVWLTGALFREKSKGFSAVVKTEGNLLRIFVRAEKPRYTADMYLDTIRDALERINADMNLKVAENQVVYKADGIVECFNYDMLVGSQNAGLPVVYSTKRNRAVKIEEILSQTDHRVDEAREKLIGHILSACRSLQASQIYWKAREDDRNTYIRDVLRAKGYFVADQTRSGISAGGKQAGELDLDIRWEADMPWTILEALNLSGKGDTQIAYWDDHLKKLLDNYNANGLPFLLQVSYVECPKDKFGTVCTAYSEHLRFHSPAQYTCALRTEQEGYGENHFIQAYQCVYDCDGFPTTVYHFFVRMGE